MKTSALVLCLSAAVLPAADLASIRTVYILPMARGLDQYLANRLTNEHIFQVVTAPKAADAFFTDRIGEAFQVQMETMLPAPPPTTAERPKKETKDENRNIALPTETVNKLSNPALNSSFGRGRGTVFLVDAKSKEVIWSTYDPAKSSGGKDLDRTASDIVNRLKRDLHPSTK